MSFRLDPTMPCDAEIRRVTLHQIRKAEKQAGAVTKDPLKGPHETRKTIKKIRAVLRLARQADERYYRSENARWRDISAALAGPREVAALVETVDRFIAEFLDQANRSTLLTMRARLALRLDALKSDVTALRAAAKTCLEGCHAASATLESWRLPRAPEAGVHLLAKGAKATWQDAEAARARAARHGKEDDFHDLRKAVKRHWTHLGLLREFWPGPVGRRRIEVERLGELLGELNDIFVMNALMREGGIGTDLDIHSRFSRLLAEKREQLAAVGLAEAGRLFGRPPGGLKTAFRTVISASRSAGRARTGARRAEAA